MGKKKVPLTIANEIYVKGKVVAKRVVGAIDPEVLKVVAYKVEAAYVGDRLFSDKEKEDISEIEITSMPHEESVMDPDSHISLQAKDKSKQPRLKGHVPIDPAKQQAAR